MPTPKPTATKFGDTRSEARATFASVIDRAEELLRQMTIEEKVMQLSSVFPLALFNMEGTNRGQLDALLKNGIGHVSALGLIGHKTPETLAKSVNAIQRYLVTETRLKIPAIFHNEAMSGVVAPHFTAFPTSIGLAATWDPAATEAMADIIRRQMRAVGMLQALAPVMDVARDARWGRVSETYGEDPYLVTAMSVAYARGLQGNDLTKGVLATAKHFVGYAVTEGGQNMAATAVGARELYDVYARRSVRRVLRDKFALGLFDNPYVSEDAITIRTVASEGTDLSRRLAAESVTLLKNENGVLPLRRDIAKIAIIGPTR